MLAIFCANVHAEPHAEYAVKVAFIHSIADKFVEWPASVGAKRAVRLCILGHGLFEGATEDLRGKLVGGKAWEVAPVSASADLRECQVLFIEASESAKLSRLLGSLNGSPVLTVGDTGGYAEQGVMVNFYNENNKVRFEINNGAARRAGLKISSHLLKLARIIQDNGG